MHKLKHRDTWESIPDGKLAQALPRVLPPTPNAQVLLDRRPLLLSLPNMAEHCTTCPATTSASSMRCCTRLRRRLATLERGSTQPSRCGTPSSISFVILSFKTGRG
mgnify:CR=1 FL=1